MVHSLTLNYMDKVSQLIFFAKGVGKGGVRLVCSCSLRVAVPSPPLTKEKQKTVRARSFSLFFSFVGGRVRLHVGYRSCPCLSQLCERLHQGGCQHIFKGQVLS